MKKLIAVAACAVLLQTVTVAQAGVNFNINVGGPPITITDAPDFLFPPGLSFGIAVGLPYDLFYLADSYFVYRGGGWYRAPAYGEKWVRVPYRHLPHELRRYKIRQLREFRDREYRDFRKDRTNYRGRHFRPGDGPGAAHRDMRHDVRENRRDDRREMRETHKDERKDVRKEHKEDRREMREDHRGDGRPGR